METLKIALVSDWYYPKLGGGVAVHMHDLALYLRGGRGHEVDIITNNRKTGKEDELRELGIGLVKVPGKIFPSASLNVSAFAKGYGLLEPLIRDYEVVHGHHAFTPLSLKAAMAARKLGKGSVVTTHSINYENSFTIRTMSRASYPYYRYHLTYPHRIIAVSKASREFIKRFTRVPVRIVPNGINLERFDIPVSKEEAKELLNLDGKVVLYVGRLEPEREWGLSYRP